VDEGSIETAALTPPEHAKSMHDNLDGVCSGVDVPARTASLETCEEVSWIASLVCAQNIFLEPSVPDRHCEGRFTSHTSGSNSLFPLLQPKLNLQPWLFQWFEIATAWQGSSVCSKERSFLKKDLLPCLGSIVKCF
jgi:hypothetical protein